MKRDLQIENEVRDTLTVFDGLKRVEARPELFDAIRERQHKTARGSRIVLIARIAAAVVLLVLNSAVLVQTQTQPAEDIVSLVASDYGLSYGDIDYLQNTER